MRNGILLVLLFAGGCSIARPKVEIQIRAKEVQASPEYQINISL